MKKTEGGDNITPIKAVLIRHTRLQFTDGGLIEIKLWSVQASLDKPHGYKYSLVYIAEGRRIIGYDNAERRGDHRHDADREEPYRFTSLDRLVSDFLKDVERLRRGK
jgi:hypothetical protein